MAAFQQWSFPLPEVTYNPATTTNVSSYFGRHSKVVKPNSRNSSPRNLRRRKTTTAVSNPSRTTSVVDHLRSTAQWQNPGMSRSRPISWHPDYFTPSTFDLSPAVHVDDSCWNFSTVQVNGLATPISYPLVDEPHIQGHFTPLDELAVLDHSWNFDTQQYCQQTWLSQGSGKRGSFPLPTHGQQQSLQPEWHLNQASMMPHVPTAPSSPDCPPLQNIRLDTLSLGNNSRKSRSDLDELVGMGLYDSPAEVQSSSLLFSGFPGKGRKGLKLEESFEPSEQDDADEEEIDEDDQDLLNAQDEEVAASWPQPAAMQYESQSIASHLTYGVQQRPEPLATEYLATLRQMNSAYYPTDQLGYGQAYGWI